MLPGDPTLLPGSLRGLGRRNNPSTAPPLPGGRFRVATDPQSPRGSAAPRLWCQGRTNDSNRCPTSLPAPSPLPPSSRWGGSTASHGFLRPSPCLPPTPLPRPSSSPRLRSFICKTRGTVAFLQMGVAGSTLLKHPQLTDSGLSSCAAPLPPDQVQARQAAPHPNPGPEAPQGWRPGPLGTDRTHRPLGSHATRVSEDL